MGKLLALALILLAACGDDDGGGGGIDAGHVPEAFSPTDATRAYCAAAGGDDDAIEARITVLLGQMTIYEKVELMHGASLNVVDGVWLVEGLPRVGIPGFRMLDGPRGVAKVSGLKATAFPVAMMRGATWDPALEQRVGAAMAKELRASGGNVLLAPTVNILRHPRWGRAQETYGEDTHHMGAMAVSFVNGVQGEGVLASVKHFAANSIEDTRHVVDVTLDERTLREIYLPHFGRVVREAHVASVMSAYNSVNGLYCDQQPHLLIDILKTEWQFAGFVESDWILGTHGDVESVTAGLDLEMPFGTQFAGLGDLLDEREVDKAVRRLLRAQLCYGLDTMTVVPDDPSQRETPEHLALAEEVAVRGAVLLKNEAGALPLGAGVGSIVVAGRNAEQQSIGDSGSSAVEPTDVITAAEGIAARAGVGVQVTVIAGATLTPADEAAVAAADVVVVVTGLQEQEEGEATIGAGDRDLMTVPAADVALIHALAALNPRVVVVLEGGSAFVVADWDGEIEALLMAFYPGSQGGAAIAALLFGDAAPSGRLPFSMPVAEADLPPFDHESEMVTYGYFHGYRHLLNEGTLARYPFGFGLSYTTFAYSDLTLDATTVAPDGVVMAEVTVTNTGTVAAIETVQLYVTPVNSAVERSPRDLRAFQQVALAPGASAQVLLPVRVEDLAYWDVGTSAWVVEPLAYRVHVARHAEDAGLLASFTVE